MKHRVFIAATLCTAALGGVHAQPAQPAPSPRAEIVWTRPICANPDRYIGWPSVARLQNGDLIAVFSGDREVLVAAARREDSARNVRCRAGFPPSGIDGQR